MKTSPLAALFFVFLLHACISPAAYSQPGPDSRDRLPGFLRNATLTDQQRAEAKAINAKFREKMNDLQRRETKVYREDQRRQIQQTMRQAREAGKSRQETRKLVDESLDLTDEQRASLTAFAKEREALLREMQTALRALRPEDQTRPVQGGNRSERIAPTHANVSYGDHKRHLIDVWLAESDAASPVLFSIHGGGFRGGNKGVDPSLLQACLDRGISVVAATYRLSQDAIAPASFHDAARAVQFVRSKADEWNLDKNRFASTGGSAGAGLSLWLAFHDDLADSGNADRVRRESTRLSCAAVYNGQTTYDPREIRKLIPEADTYQHSALAQLYDVDLTKLGAAPPEKLALFEEVSAMPHLSKDDVPVLLAYATNLETPVTNQGIGIHHPRFGEALKKKMDALGIECIVETNSRRGSEQWVEQTMNFVTKHLDVIP